MSEQTAHAHDIRPYLFVFGALLVLTVVTVTVSYLHLPPGPAIALGLAIATVKAALVAAFFMHLKGERAIIYGALAITVFFLIVLFVLPITDSQLNSPQGRAPGRRRAGRSGGIAHALVFDVSQALPSVLHRLLGGPHGLPGRLVIPSARGGTSGLARARHRRRGRPGGARLSLMVCAALPHVELI